MTQLLVSIITGITLLAPFALAKSNPDIKSWETKKAEKGFILYKYLKKESGCYDDNSGYIWDYHVVEFKKHNPGIKNVHVIPTGNMVEVQRCNGTLVAQSESLIDPVGLVASPVVASPVNQENNQSDEEDVTESSGSQVVEDATTAEVGIATAEGSNELVKAESSDDKSNNIIGETVLFASAGFISEEDDKTDAALGFRFKTNVYSRVEYQGRFDVSPRAVYFNHQINFITLPDDKYNLYFIGVGLGQRYSIKKEFNEENQRRTTDLYPFATLGYRKDYKKGYLEAQIGSNISKEPSINVSLLGMKRLGNSDYMLGGYADWRASKSPIDNSGESRKYFTGGIIFSY